MTVAKPMILKWQGKTILREPKRVHEAAISQVDFTFPVGFTFVELLRKAQAYILLYISKCPLCLIQIV